MEKYNINNLNKFLSEDRKKEEISLYEQFINYSVNHGANMDNLHHEIIDNYEFVSFKENAPKDDNGIYNISLVFYDSEDVVEIYIGKSISANNEIEIYKFLNEYNLKYRGIKFVYINDMVCLKSFCVVGGDINIALKLLAKNMEVAQNVFSLQTFKN